MATNHSLGLVAIDSPNYRRFVERYVDHGSYVSAASSNDLVMYCTCYGSSRSGFRQVSGWWVCGFCGLPTRPFVRAMIRTNGGQQREDGEDHVGLIHFRGGPIDGYTYDSETLLGTAGLELPVADYNWTSEKLKSEKTGAVAQVWVHKNGPNTVTGVTPAPTIPDGATDTTPPQKTYDKNEEGGWQADPLPSSPDVIAAQATDRTDRTEASESPSDAPNDAPSGYDSSNLEQRRKDVKKSRKQVSDATGLAQSKVWGIETGNAKKATTAEVQKFAKYIADCEAGNA